MKKYIFFNRKWAVLHFLAVVLLAAGLLFVAVEMGSLVNILLYEYDVNLVYIVVRMVLVLFVTAFALSLFQLASRKHHVAVNQSLEEDLSLALLRSDVDTSRVINILNNEIDEVIYKYIHTFFNYVRVVAYALGALIFTVTLSWQVLVYALGIMFFNIFVSHLFAKKLSSDNKDVQNEKAKVLQTAQGFFGARTSINIFGATDYSMEALKGVYSTKNKRFFKAGVFSGAIVGGVNNFIGWLAWRGTVIAIYIFVFLQYMDLGQAVTFVIMLEYLLSPVHEIMQLKNFKDSTKSIRADLAEILSAKQQEVEPLDKNQDIIFKNVDFSFDGESEFMKDISLRFEHGKKYMIVGASGSGKSTLLKLILKSLQPTSGAIFYGEKNYTDINAPTLYQNIAYCSQKIEMIPGTLRQNISMCKYPDNERVERAINMVNLNYLKEKLDIELTENVDNFSGGELQRIAIARMLYKDSPIFLFDEFSSALDNANAEEIEKCLINIKDKLIINITHRMHEEIAKCYDKKITINKGKLNV